MISLRHHIVSIAAVFFAMAAGLALGYTALSQRSPMEAWSQQPVTGQQAAALEPERDTLRTQLAGAKRFLHDIGPMAVHDRLDRRTVTLISTGEVPDGERDAIRELLRSAGAFVTGEVRFTSNLGDPAREQQLRGVATTLMPSEKDLPVAADSGTLVGSLVGALTTLDPATGDPRSSPDEREAAFRGLADGGFVHPLQDVLPAELAVVLTNDRSSGGHPNDRAATIAHVAAQIGRTSSGTVLAGATGSAHRSGAVAFTRADTSLSALLSTVDNADEPSGRIALVAALAEQWEGESGHYGTAGGAQGQLPSSRE